MAKQRGAIRFTGKFANAVGYISKAAKKADSTFMRERASQVSNPKSYGQAKQRAKSVPAILFYNQFKKYLNHAFVPAGGAGKNYAQFLKYALSLNEIPDVWKNDPRLPMLPYKISKGALGVSNLCAGTFNAGQIANYHSYIGFQLKCTDGALTNATVASFSADILAQNPVLSEGMEVTIMAVLGNLEDLSQRIGVAGSVVLNTQDTITKVSDCFPMGVVDVFGQGGHLIAGALEANGFGLLTAGVIISAKSGDSWIYTNSRMYQTSYAQDGFDWDPEEVIASYMDSASSRESEKPLQQAANSNALLVVPVSVANEAYTITDPVTGATYNHDSAAIVTMSDGSRRVVVNQAGTIQYYDGTGFESVNQTVTEGSSERTDAVLLSATTWAGNPTIDESRVSF